MRIAIACVSLIVLTAAGWMPLVLGADAPNSKKSGTAKKRSKKKGTASKKGSTASGASSATKKGATAAKASGKKGSRRGRSKKGADTWRSRQLAPTPERYTQIQDALAKKGYLQGPATGKWDQASADALRKFQKEQNLEANGKIDSLSLIALGLGPHYDSAVAVPPPPAPEGDKK